MIKTLGIPQGVAKIFMIDSCNQFTINDKYQHRPDNILKINGMSSFKQEMVNNNISNTSPISMVKGTVYTTVSSYFVNLFGNNNE